MVDNNSKNLPNELRLMRLELMEFKVSPSTLRQVQTLMLEAAVEIDTLRKELREQKERAEGPGKQTEEAGQSRKLSPRA